MTGSTNFKATTALAAATLAILSSADIATAQSGFKQITTDFGDSKPKGVVLPTICIGNFVVPKTMYTFEATTGNDTDIKILTNPEDLVETGYDGDSGLIYFKFNQNVSETADDAGVLIRFPAGQLESVNACCSQSVQMKRGFTNFQSLTATTSANVNATFAVAQDSGLSIGVSSNAEVNVQVKATADKMVNITVRDEATVGVSGDVSKINCINKSSCKLTGSVLVPAESRTSEESILKVPTCEGIIVDKQATCESKTPNVRVVTSSDLVISGKKEICAGGDDLNGMGGPATPYTEAPTLSAAPTASPAPTMKPTPRPTTKPTESPVELPVSGAFYATKQGAFASIALGGAVMLLLLAQ